MKNLLSLFLIGGLAAIIPSSFEKEYGECKSELSTAHKEIAEYQVSNLQLLSDLSSMRARYDNLNMLYNQVLDIYVRSVPVRLNPDDNTSLPSPPFFDLDEYIHMDVYRDQE